MPIKKPTKQSYFSCFIEHLKTVLFAMFIIWLLLKQPLYPTFHE